MCNAEQGLAPNWIDQFIENNEFICEFQCNTRKTAKNCLFLWLSGQNEKTSEEDQCYVMPGVNWKIYMTTSETSQKKCLQSDETKVFGAKYICGENQ